MYEGIPAAFTEASDTKASSFHCSSILLFYFYLMTHPVVSSLSRVRNQDGPLQLCRTQYGPPLAQSEDRVPALQRRFGEETCS